mgnify:CR=1 FL=1
MNETPLDCALRAIANAVPDTADNSQRIVAAKCGALMVGYDAAFGRIDYTPLSAEQFVETPLINPDTNQRSRTFTVAGRLDVTCLYHGRTVLIDHKTTSSAINEPDHPFWRQLAIEGQVSHYMLLEWLSGRKVDEAVWDVVRKPMISPRKISKAERAHAVANRTWFGQALSGETLDALQTCESETLEMYSARLAHDCAKERPQWYFQRRTVPRLDSEIIEYARELWEHGQEILHVRNTNRHVRNSGACMLYGSPCKFLGICSGYDTPDSDNWQVKAQVHNELPELNCDGRSVLTNSRIRCFQTCRRKHYYEYELGISRIDEEEREALFFGTIWHHALAAWWEHYLNTRSHDNGNCDQGSPAERAGKYGSHSEAVIAE